MTTKSQDGLLGLTLVALLVTLGGDLLGMTLLVAVGVTSFSLALIGLLALMTVSLVVGVSRTSGPDMHDPLLADRTYL
ncbi:hypothetical protein [Halorubrum salsamenti]|jgi:hypothetical protein|uniref:hypothetical protein n=1 Tax=Halorubrum salsamenti TaxID=2583990 RepID=UPI0011A3CB28|nr:hypothetical protein [Halorubrum salsamenti]